LAGLVRVHPGIHSSIGGVPWQYVFHPRDWLLVAADVGGPRQRV
jgi:hypothetical protein